MSTTSFKISTDAKRKTGKAGHPSSGQQTPDHLSLGRRRRKTTKPL